jgi:hypothetical protein
MDTIALKLFNEKVSRLEASRLAQRMSNPKYQIQYDKVASGQWIAADGIEPDDVDAFVLNLRLLVQDNDGFSIRCLSKLYGEADVASVLQAQFQEHHNRLSSHLDRPSPIGRPGGNGNYTNRQLFDVIMYGGLAHNDRKKVGEFLCLVRQGFFSAIVFASFLNTIGVIFQTCRHIRDLNLQLLNEGGQP